MDRLYLSSWEDQILWRGIVKLKPRPRFLVEAEDIVNLTDIWKAQGSPGNQTPYFWLRLPDAKRFIEQLQVGSNLRKSQVLKIKRGKGGGTFAHWQILLAYAVYL